ncbi:ParB/RepB/Spo0J family partition protein [Pedobacter sp. SYP-B3415]|uniref:ParB/RepB/Spo0J family partition protein n=1 Tax=Pedobacter sp. SYP-B3415 TaxID=2496641 RepID=UPI00101E16B7|nr:ParB/RepB/Spo0J family partition protein [Pedobacter sp. SYP-B3415]
MSRFSDFGLQEKKTAEDVGTEGGDRLCLWCDSKVRTGFSMCFANFVICGPCAASRSHTIECDVTCEKCFKKNVEAYRCHATYSVSWHLCYECIEWADTYLNSDRMQRFNDQIVAFRKIAGGHANLMQICTLVRDRAIDLSAEDVDRIFTGEKNAARLIKRTNSLIDQGFTTALATDIINYQNMGKKQDVQTISAPALQFVPLDQIRVNKLNPRKTFDQDALAELTESVRKLGVIQALTLRPYVLGSGYELICGERRYHAAIAAGLTEVPASIRDLSDQEAMEMMVTENLQRKDVHPLEEAEAFKFMIKSMNYSLTDIAAKIGKGNQFVARRLLLNDLTDDLKAKSKSEELPIGHAEVLARLQPDFQSVWYEQKFGKEPGYWERGAGTLSSLKQWVGTHATNDLSKATFDITEPGFAGVATPCTTCPKNSACMIVMFEDDKPATCTDPKCFSIKRDAQAKIDLDRALADPDVQLINYAYNESSLCKQLKQDGHMFLNYQGCTWVDKPERDNVDREDFETDEEFNQAQKDAEAEYHEEVADFKKKISDGVVTRVYDVYSMRFGYVRIYSNRALGTQSGPPSIDMQVADQEQKKKRGRELDNEKVMKKLVDHLKDHSIMTDQTKPLDPREMNALIVLAYENLGYGNFKNKIHELLGLPSTFYAYNTGGQQLFEAISKASDEVKALIVRRALYNKFSGISSGGINLGVTFNMAQVWCNPEYWRMQLDQQGIRERREAKIDARIKELKGGAA